MVGRGGQALDCFSVKRKLLVLTGIIISKQRFLMGKSILLRKGS